MSAATRRAVLACALVTTALIVAPRPIAQQRPARDAAVPPPAGTGIVAGTVVADGDGAPVRRAIVTLGSSEALGTRAVVTDDAGRFLFDGLPAGRFSLNVTKPGWVTSYYGAPRPGRGPATPLALADGQAITGLSMTITRGAVVTGRVIDELGQPVSGLRTMILEFRTVGGRRTLAPVSSSGSLSVQTDDRGQFRVFGLPPGEYIVGATPTGSVSQPGFRQISPEEIRWARQQAASSLPLPPRPGGNATFAAVYYPGTSDTLQAATIALKPAEERAGVDFTLRHVAVARVSGVVRRPDGQPLITPQISLSRVQESIPVVNLDPMSSPRASLRNGVFTFPAVVPGRYVLTVRSASQRAAPPATSAAGVPAGPTFRQLDLWASTEISVQGEDVEGLSLTLEPGLTVAGRIAFEGSTIQPPADLSQVRIQLMDPEARLPGSSDSNVYMGMAAADATFAIRGVMPGDYQLSVFMPGNTPAGPRWVVKSAIVGGRNVFDRPFTIRSGGGLDDIAVTMTDRVTELSGVLQDALGRPAPDFQMLVFSTDKSAWTSMSPRLRPPTRPASDGRYRVVGLPPGEYFVAALGEIAAVDYLDASFLEQVAAAALKITLGEGEKKQLDLKLQGKPPFVP
jgi:hypothetical protein